MCTKYVVLFFVYKFIVLLGLHILEVIFSDKGGDHQVKNLHLSICIIPHVYGKIVHCLMTLMM